MGTKVEYSINLLPTSVDRSKLLNVGGVDVWEHYHHNKGLSLTNNFQRTGINFRLLQQEDPMDRRILDRNNSEYIKKTMQMHEDIFKHQVRELHRVYNLQKKLMNELKTQQHIGMLNGIEASQPHFIQHQASQTSSYHPLDHQIFHAQQGLLRSRERSSGSCSGGDRDTIKLKRGFEFDLEMPAPEKEVFIGPRGIHHECRTNNVVGGVSNEEEIQVDLTLSIGGSTSTSSQVVKKSQLECLESSPNVGGEECNDPSTPMSSSTSVTFTQERSKGPHWLSQGLKLK